MWLKVIKEEFSDIFSDIVVNDSEQTPNEQVNPSGQTKNTDAETQPEHTKTIGTCQHKPQLPLPTQDQHQPSL